VIIILIIVKTTTSLFNNGVNKYGFVFALTSLNWGGL